MVFMNAADDFQFAFLRVDLQQVNPGEAVFADDVGNRRQGTFDGFRVEPVGGQFEHIRVLHFFLASDQLVLKDVSDHRLDGGAVLAEVRVKAGEDRGVFVKRELRVAFLFGDAGVEGVDSPGVAIRRAVRLQEIEHAGRRLESEYGRIFALAQNEEREEPDVRADIDDRIAVRELDVVPEIGSVPENLLIDVIRLVAVEVDDLESVREGRSRP